MADDTTPDFVYNKVDPDGTPQPFASKKKVSWAESDESYHIGVEYTFDPLTSGLPPLRVEWVSQTNNEFVKGLGFLFMATFTDGPSDYNWDHGDGFSSDTHPDNEQHYRDTLWDDGLSENEAVNEMQRRYMNWLKNIHPSQYDQLMREAQGHVDTIIAAAQGHGEVVTKILAINPDAEIPCVPLAMVEAVASNDPHLMSGVTVTAPNNGG